uniref:BTB domain-containing protein n=1 Tax=Panagrolaimus davidi TaxID=227884 RepID=A0A914PRB6_9BILA
MFSKLIIFCWILFILTEKINAGIFVKGKTHSIDPIGYGGAKDPASLQSPQQTRPKRDAEKVKIRSPIAMQWTIPEERLKEFKDNPGGPLSSSFFDVSNIPGVQYYIKFFPNDDQEDRIGETGIYLVLSFTDEMKIEANYTFSIESANYSREFYSVFEKSVGWGGKCCSAEEFFDSTKKFIVDEKVTIKMDGILYFENEADENGTKLDDESSINSLGLSLWNFVEGKNITIVAGDGKEINAHKCVLASRSPYFAKILESVFTKTAYVIENFSSEIIEKAIKLCYHQSLVRHTTLEDKMKLLQFFDKYDFPSLKGNLESNLISKIDASNVCRLTNVALTSDAQKLEEKCSEFLLNSIKNKAVADIDLLDKDFALKLLKNAFYPVSE